MNDTAALHCGQQRFERAVPGQATQDFIKRWKSADAGPEVARGDKHLTNVIVKLGQNEQAWTILNNGAHLLLFTDGISR
jgi:hypothetical protein